jgi:hypothetical protein
MSVHDGLNVVTLVMCILTLSMATAALLPQIKQGLLLLRDGVLWTLLVSVVALTAYVGWSRFSERIERRLGPTSVSERSTTAGSAETFPEDGAELTPNRSWEAR